MNVQREHYPLLAMLFQGPVLSQLADFGRSTLIDEILATAELWDWFRPGRKLEYAFESAYQLLRQRYRSEYLYKNVLAEKILLGRHSLRTAMLVPEMRVGGCRADIVIFNGTSTAYEIKTGLDNLDRLNAQLNSYREAFDRTCVITEEGLDRRISAAVDDDVGILVLTKRYTIKTIREPVSNVHRVQPSTIFELLREREYMQIIRDEFGAAPDVPNGIRYSVFRDLFLRLPPERAHAAMVRELKKRAGTHGLAQFVSSLPPSLKAAGFAAPLSKTQRLRLSRTLLSDYPLFSRYEPVHQLHVVPHGPALQHS
jgi:hypothetical protein